MADKNDFSEILAEMLIRMDRQQAQLDKTNEILNTVVKVQERMLTQMELIYEEQQRFNRRIDKFVERQEEHNRRMDGFLEQQQQLNARQEERSQRLDESAERQQQFNARQEEVNLAILQELRLIKTDVRELKEVVLNNHEDRLRRLEDFMRRAS